MKVSTILDHIDSGHMALPEFQRGYVWNRDQVRGLFDSLYRRHPVGGVLVWGTESKTATHRGDGVLAAGMVKLLLWGTGLPLKASLLGKMSRLEVHHIFPKAKLYKREYRRPEVNASTGAWRIYCTATPGGSRVRRRSRLWRPVSLAVS